MLKKIVAELKKLNVRVILLLGGILFIALAIQMFMYREGFESAILNSTDKLLDQMDEESKRNIVNEVKTNVSKMTTSIQTQVDYLLPCLLKMDSCPQGLKMSPYGTYEPNIPKPASGPVPAEDAPLLNNAKTMNTKPTEESSSTPEPVPAS
jgi:hypothetical protein